MIVQLSNDDGSLADLLWSYKYQKQMEGEGVFSREFNRKGTCVLEQSLPPSGDDTMAYSSGLHISLSKALISQIPCLAIVSVNIKEK